MCPNHFYSPCHITCHHPQHHWLLPWSFLLWSMPIVVITEICIIVMMVVDGLIMTDCWSPCCWGQVMARVVVESLSVFGPSCLTIGGHLHCSHCCGSDSSEYCCHSCSLIGGPVDLNFGVQGVRGRKLLSLVTCWADKKTRPWVISQPSMLPTYIAWMRMRAVGDMVYWVMF